MAHVAIVSNAVLTGKEGVFRERNALATTSRAHQQSFEALARAVIRFWFSFHRNNNYSVLLSISHLSRLTLLLNLTSGLVGWYKISLQGLLRLYENPLRIINPTKTTFIVGGGVWRRKQCVWDLISNFGREDVHKLQYMQEQRGVAQPRRTAMNHNWDIYAMKSA